MSHLRLKTKYKEDDGCGDEEEHTLYAHLNLSCDITSFYDEHGKYLFSIHDCVKDNLLVAINNLCYPYNVGEYELRDGIEHMTVDEFKMCGL